MKLIKWLLVSFIWLALFSSIAVTWSLLNLPETESIQISDNLALPFRQGWPNYSFMEMSMVNQFSFLTYLTIL